MSDDLLRTARQFLVELRASETHLQAAAVLALPYASVLAAERRGTKRCAELLAALGSAGFELSITPLDDTTDELLRGAIRARDVSQPAPRAPQPALAAASTVGAPSGGNGYEPFADDGPEGAADGRHDPPSETDETTGGPILESPIYDDELDVEPLPDLELEEMPASAVEPVEDDDTDETPVPGPVPEPAQPSPPSYISYEDASADGLQAIGSSGSGPRHAAESGSLVSFDDVPPSDEEPTLGGGRSKQPASTDVDAYVSYDEPSDEDSSETLIQDAAAPAKGRTPPGASPRVASFSDVGADALVTVEERSTDLLQDSLADDDIEELELDNSDSFDLMPDVGEEDSASFEDEEVTMVKAAETVDWKAAAAPSVAATPATVARKVTPGGKDRAAGPFSAGEVGAYASDAATPEVTDASELVSRTPKPTTRRPAPPKPVAPSVAVGGSKATAGLYGGSGVPTIRDSDEPRPRAAAIQLNAGGSGGKVLGLEEEEEPIEIGAAEDYGDEEAEADLADGFSVTLQAHEEPEWDEEEEEDEEEEDQEVIEPVAEPEPVGPTPEELRAMLDRAHSTAAAGDLQGGADLFSDALDMDPDSIEARVSRGRLYLDLGDYSRAMSDFMMAEDIAPTDPEPQVAIGDLYFARKDYRKAIDYFNAALELSPNHPMAYCRRGISHYYRKNYQEAVTDLLKAEKLDPDIPNIQTYVTMAKKKVKR